MFGKRLFVAVSLLTVLSLVATSGMSSARAPESVPDALAPQAVLEGMTAGPLMFIENVGQFADGARYLMRGGSGVMWLADDALWITVLEASPRPSPMLGTARALPPDVRETKAGRGVHLKLTFPGANAQPKLEPFHRLDTRISYIIGNDPDGWRPEVPVWGGVRYKDLYPGIDLELTSEGGALVQRVVAAPGADLSAVRLRVEGADAVALEGDNLRLTTRAGQVILPLFQVAAAEGASLKGAGKAQVAGAEIAWPFVAGSTEETLSAASILALENPAGLYASTLLGGSSYDYAKDVAVDSSGAVYVAGETWSSGFPTTPGAFDRTFSVYDAFVVKFNAGLSSLIYGTFIGGSSGDGAYAIAVDAAGAAYITGMTTSSNFPTSATAFDRDINDHYYQDAFVFKLNAAGSAMVYGTYVGGNNEDEGTDIALDGTGAAYITGYTYSNNLPTNIGALKRTLGGTSDGFVYKLNATGSAMVYGTYLGGGGRDEAVGIAVSGGVAYVAGWTASTDFPTTVGALSRTFAGGYNDGFVVKMNAVGSALMYGTYLGGAGGDAALGIAVSSGGEAYVTGFTASGNFPTTPGAYDTTYNGGDYDGFLVRLKASGATLIYGTYLGGGHKEEGRAVAILPNGLAYVLGFTWSANFPTTVGAVDRSLNGESDAFVCKVRADGSALAYSTYLGGDHSDSPHGIALDAGGSAYVVGYTWSSNFPTTAGAYDRGFNGTDDAFVAKLAMKRIYLQRVNAGSGAAKDSAGNWWGADRAFTTGSWGYLGAATGTYTTTQAIAGTNDDVLYQTERNNMSEYRFTVPNGTYSVTLRFSENLPAVTAAGQRVFSVRAEGTAKLVDFDIFAAAGGKYKAVDRSFTVTVSDGVLNLQFVPRAGRPPKVGAITVQTK